ncbi:MAG: phospho-N-acetylmuramoyl-pentapeptide-transferase, partial [SAR324 cluster bacterium]|nr:phospho-N-acetylmuramoyl-pentapeptide-transferase [SAR324 cluster bacterium]
MLYYLLYERLVDYVSFFNVFRYLTFRTAYAGLTALMVSLILGPWMIRKLREFQIGQIIRDDGPGSHRGKAGTPTMGGLLIVASILVPTLLWADLGNRFVWLAMGATVSFGIIGFWDDYQKVIKRQSEGLTARNKIRLQIVAALTVGFVLLVLSAQGDFSTRMVFPFFK